MAPHVLMTYPSTLQSHGGGTEGCVEISRHLLRLGARVTLVPVRRGPESGPRRVEGRVVSTSSSRLHYLLDGRPASRTLRRLARNDRIDAVLGWTTEAAFLPGLVHRYAPLFGMIAAFPSYRLWENRVTSLRRLKRISDYWFRARPLRRADVVFALSNFTRQELVSLFGLDPERIVVAHWGIDESFHHIPRSRPPAVRRFLFFGSLEPVKGVFDALDALGRVAASGRHDWELRVAGWGDQAAVLNAARRHGIEDRVTLLGALSHQALAGHLEWADLALLPSHADSFGLAIAEAQASGLPVVSCDVCAIPEVVEKDETSWLVQPGRPEQLAGAIVDAMDHPIEAYRRGLAGRERMKRLFAWERTAACMLGAIEQRLSLAAPGAGR